MDFICDIFIVGFWFTAGVLTCTILVGIISAVALKVTTAWEYKIAERRRDNVTSK